MPRSKKSSQENFIKFLGTAGARFVMIKQLRASGGIWINCEGTNVLVDPGPGSIVRCAASRPKLDPSKLEAIILTHRHLDHSNDVNVMIEAMTEGGFKKRGRLFITKDAVGEDSVVLKHALNFVESVEYLEEKKEYSVGNFIFKAGPRNLHPVETYGLKFDINAKSISLIGDTAFYPALLDFYKTDIVIVNTVFYEPRPTVQHLSFPDTKHIILQLNPKIAILTHFGMTMLKAKPSILAQELKNELSLDVLAAYDGMTFVP